MRLRGDIMNKRKIQRITFTALMTSVAVVLSYVESLLPPAAFMPPGAKLGLSNIAVMFSASSLSIGETLIIVLAKSIFALITRGFTAFLMSLTGGIFSALCLIFILRKTKNTGYIGTGVASALCHNAGQLLVSFILIKSPAVFGYTPVLILTSLGTGFLTGILLKTAMPYLKRSITKGDG